MPPITLTKQQFLQQKPNGNYQTYLNFISRARTSRAAGATAAPAAAPLDPLSAATARFMNMMPGPAGINAQVNAELAANKAEVAAQQQFLANQATRAQGFASALATATAPNPQQIASQYQDAADRLRAYGTGLTGSVQAAQQAEASQSADAAKAITGGLGSVGGYDPDAIRNAVQMTGVVLPGGSLERAAADAAVRAAYNNQASVGQVGMIAQDYLNQGNQLQAQLAARNIAAQAQRPALAIQARSAARQDMATLISALGMQSLMNYRTGRLGISQAGQAGGVYQGGGGGGG